MFPIPFNFPFRKSNGAMTTIGDAISEGGGSYTLPTASESTKGGVKIGSGLSMSGEVLNATAELPEYSSATAGKVLTVDENGDLEWDTKGSGGGDTFINHDYTKIGTRTVLGVSYSDAGASFDNTNDVIPIFGISSFAYGMGFNNITLYVDVEELLISASTNHQRFIMGSNNNGLIYRDSGVWAFYSDGWNDSEITDPTYFSNCKVKIYIDTNNKWHIYKNNVLVFEPNNSLNANMLTIGSFGGSSILSGLIKGTRVYNGDYTE